MSGPSKDQEAADQVSVAGPASQSATFGTILAGPTLDFVGMAPTTARDVAAAQSWLGNTKVNEELGTGGSREPAPDDSLAPLDDRAVETVSYAALRSAIRQRMLAAALRDFIAELGRQGAASNAETRLRSFLKQLLTPATAARFVGGYLGSAVAGTIGRPSGPTALPAGRYTVVVVGAPGPGELPGHAFQFADAAAQVPGLSRVWLVERSGYEMARVDLGDVEARAQGAPVFWITPATLLTTLLGQFPPGSIAELRVFSHGVPGKLTLRYGWPGTDYGLSLSDTRSLSPRAFTEDAEISFDSCNTATDPSMFPGIEYGERSLAQEVADATGRPVQAWVGRTSYRQVNRGLGSVEGSEIFSGGLHPDVTELYSNVVRQRAPRQVVAAPSRASGDWSSWFRINARLPESRRFPVPEDGTVVVRIAARSKYDSMQNARITVVLNRDVNWWADDELPGNGAAIVGQERTLTWSNLQAGTYYLELFHLSGLEVEGDIAIRIR